MAAAVIERMITWKFSRRLHPPALAMQDQNSRLLHWNSKAHESIEQRAAQGDPTAIAELKQQEELEDPAQQTGASEPGKGQQFDGYF
jgi:hypothetical protein